MRAGDGGAQPLLRERAGESPAELGELRDGLGDGAVHAGADLHHGRVRLQRHTFAQVLRQVVEHLVRAEGERPVARVEEHELLLDADRDLGMSFPATSTSRRSSPCLVPLLSLARSPRCEGERV
jgi:hypothetical protein